MAIKKIFKSNEDTESKERLTDTYYEKTGIYQNPQDVFIISPNMTHERIIQQRPRICARILCLLTCGLFALFILFGSFVLFKYFTQPRTWYDTCSVRYRTPTVASHLIDKGGLYADDLIDKPIFDPKEIDTSEDDENDEPKFGEFKQKVNLTDQSEKIEVPTMLNYRSAAFIHDFAQNWSAIVDYESWRCFIMPLDRERISPPKNFLDMVMKTKSGYYLPDNTLIHQYMVVQEQLTDLTPYGSNINESCKDFKSYMMSKKQLIGGNHRVDKRGAIEKRCEFSSDFIHSTGRVTLVHHLLC